MRTQARRADLKLAQLANLTPEGFDFAQGAGFPTPFAVGMLQAGVMATYVTDDAICLRVTDFSASPAARRSR